MSDPHGYSSLDGPPPVGSDLTPDQAAGIDAVAFKEPS